MNYQFIFFDLDDTLFDFKKSQQKAFKAVTKLLNFTYSDELFHQYQQYNLALWQQLELGTLTKDELLATRFPNFFEPLGVTQIPNNIDAYFREQLIQANDLISGATSLLEELKQSDCSIFAASNGVYQTQINRLEKSGLLPYFDDIFISEKIGYSKPNLHFFKHAFNAIANFNKSKSIMIGDSLSSDIKGANNAQLTACWFNPHQYPLPDNVTINYQITELIQLKKILF